MHADVAELIKNPPADVGALSAEELRTARDSYQAAETSVSYARRVIQGRLDVLDQMGDRGQVDVDDAADLGGLSEALAQHTRGPGQPRPPQDAAPTDAAILYLRNLDAASPCALDDFGGEDADGRARVRECLTTLERTLTADRHELHRIIDELQGEVVRRYRSGEMKSELFA